MTLDNPTPLRCDALIIGSGQAAPALAVFLAQQGEQVILVEGEHIGGSCVNAGCTPTKTLRKSARVAHMARRAAEFGVLTGEMTIDFAKAMDRMQARVMASRNGLEGWLAGTKGVTVLRGWGRLSARTEEGFEAVVDTPSGSVQVSAGRVYLNTGTRPFLPPITGLDTGLASGHPGILDNTALLNLRACPKHLVILGGSYIGLEFGQIFKRLGAQVTIIEPSARIASREDELVSQSITHVLQEEGIRICTNAQLKCVALADKDPNDAATSRTVPDLRLHMQIQSPTGTAEEVIPATHLLVATGRLPNTERLNLASIGLAVNARGFIETNSQLETAVPDVWALGDINQRGAFTHTSYHDFEIVRDNLTRKQQAAQGQVVQLRSADDRTTIYAMFTDPPLGRVGLNAASAKALSEQTGRSFLMAQHMMAHVSRAKEESETDGLIQFIVDAQTEQFVGATVLGIQGDEIIQVVSNYMATGASYKLMRDCLPAHPTVTEFFPTILDKLKPLL